MELTLGYAFAEKICRRARARLLPCSGGRHRVTPVTRDMRLVRVCCVEPRVDDPSMGEVLGKSPRL